MIKPLRPLLLIALFLAVFSTAQAGKYVTQASLTLSVGEWTQIFLNGHQIVDQDPNMTTSRGFDKVDLTPEQICYFDNQNDLALVVTHTIVTRSDMYYEQKENLGLAYVLQLTFSDNSTAVYSSNEVTDHKVLFIEGKRIPDPTGWAALDFDDGQWKPATGTRPSIALPATLINPQTHKDSTYLEGFMFNGESAGEQIGSRRFYRRKIVMAGVESGPTCIKPRVIPTATPKDQPKLPTPTPVPPQPTPTPIPKAKPTPVPTATPRPPAPTATPRPVLKPFPTPTTVVRKEIIPTLVPTVEVKIPTPTPEPLRKERPKPTVKVEAPTPTDTPEPVAVEVAPQTIVFVKPPVNIYVAFADGPGRYKLEVFDAQNAHVVTLFDKQMYGESDQWFSWDGKNDGGTPMPKDKYHAIFSKDGKVLTVMMLSWLNPDQINN